jgi:hypothetical protein
MSLLRDRMVGIRVRNLTTQLLAIRPRILNTGTLRVLRDDTLVAERCNAAGDHRGAAEKAPLLRFFRRITGTGPNLTLVKHGLRKTRPR